MSPSARAPATRPPPTGGAGRHLGRAQAADGPVRPPREPQLLVDAQVEIRLQDTKARISQAGSRTFPPSPPPAPANPDHCPADCTVFAPREGPGDLAQRTRGHTR